MGLPSLRKWIGGAPPARQSAPLPPVPPAARRYGPEEGGDDNLLLQMVKLALPDCATKAVSNSVVFVYPQHRGATPQIQVTQMRDFDVVVFSPTLRVRQVSDRFLLYILSRSSTYLSWRMVERGGDPTFDCTTRWPGAQMTCEYLRDMVVEVTVEHCEVSDWLRNHG